MPGKNLKGKILAIIRRESPPRLMMTFEKVVKESLLLKTIAEDEDRISIGQSKIGGMPDLPSDVLWPSWQGKPLSFIAQINLSDLPDYEFLDVLPEEGILSFFYSAEQETWGFDPKDKGSWRVLYFENRELQRRIFPASIPQMGKYRSCRIEFEKTFTLPPFESPYFDMDYSPVHRKEAGQIWNMVKSLSKLLDIDSPIHRFLGHPDQIQGDMLLEAQLASHGLYCGDGSGYNQERSKELEPGAIDWQMLLQIDSDDLPGMMWGDVGLIYYLLTTDQLRNRDFDAAWMILQCT